MLIINRNQSGIADFNFIYCTLTSILLGNDNIISYLKWLKSKKKDPTCNICQATLQSQTYSHTGSTQKGRYRRLFHSEVSGDGKYQQNIKADSQQRADKLHNSFVYRSLFHRGLDQIDDPLDHLPTPYKD